MTNSQSKLKGKHVVLAGSDEYQVKARAEEVLKEIAPEDPMNLEILDAQVDTVERAVEQIDAAIQSVLTLPFFGGRKVVFLKNVTFLGDNAMGKSERVQESLERLLEQLKKIPAAEVQLLMTALALDKRRSFAKQILKLALVETYDLADLKSERSQEAWMDEVGKAMMKAGLKPQPGVVERMVELIGNDSRALHGEIEKLVLYTHPEGTVTEETVRLVVSGNREMLVWDFCDAVTLGRTSEAVTLLRQLQAQGESDVGIMTLLSNHLRLAAVGRHLVETGRLKLRRSGTFLNADLQPEGADLLPKNKKGEPPNAFRLARIVQQAEKKTAARWFEAVEVLYQTYFRLLSSASDRARILESGVVQICLL